MDFEKMLAAKAEMIPKRGFNLVGGDEYEDPGEELYLIGHYQTRKKAEAALKVRHRANPDEVVYVYGPSTA